jgi:hypothetical protein
MWGFLDGEDDNVDLLGCNAVNYRLQHMRIEAVRSSKKLVSPTSRHDIITQETNIDLRESLKSHEVSLVI